jgi:UDP:flavonoid glycosyltransferase YjiC (YdhE family)
MSKGASARILFAWELGDNHGHLVRHVQIAKTLRMRGHPVMFVVRNTTIARTALAPGGFHFQQAPIYQTRPRKSRRTINYADILLDSGYADADELDGLLRSWTTTLSLFKPDLLVADHAPTALLAARMLGIRVMMVGTGFELPPIEDPFPSLVSWRPIDPMDLAKSGSAALKTINQCLDQRQAPPLPQLSALFSSNLALVTSAVELDPYGPRNGVQYIGAINAPSAARVERWTAEPLATRAFVYLHNDIAQITPLVEALSAMEVEAICILPSLDSKKIPPSTGRLRFFNYLVDVDGLLPQASLCISNGGNGLTGKCLELGVPMLLTPVYLEQYITAHCVVKLGAAVAAPLPVSDWASLISKTLRLRRRKVPGTSSGEDSLIRYQAAVDKMLAAIGP